MDSPISHIKFLFEDAFEVDDLNIEDDTLQLFRHYDNNDSKCTDDHDSSNDVPPPPEVAFYHVPPAPALPEPTPQASAIPPPPPLPMRRSQDHITINLASRARARDFNILFRTCEICYTTTSDFFTCPNTHWLV